MIPKECRRLIEVDFPIAVVSRHAAKEKSIRHGHPSTLHLWWARRPLAACRAVLLGLLLPDPGDAACPAEFKVKARELLEKLRGKVGPSDDELRKELLVFIGDFANWDVASHPVFLEVGRRLVRAAHGDDVPLVVDPFAGGGSIPLEALRLGCDAFASDLNPVACLILKVMLEDIPRHGPGLAEELRRAGKEIKAAAEKELAEFYPADSDGARPIAYLWARTVRCEAPNCGAEIPLVRSFWLCKKAKRLRALRHRVERVEGQAPSVLLEVFEPRDEKDVPAGTVSRAKARCLDPECRAVLSPERVRAQLAAQRGGADVIFDDEGRRIGGARLLAVVMLKDDAAGRQYRLPTERDFEVVWRAKRRLAEVTSQPLPGDLTAVPGEPLPPIGTLGFRVQRYGMVRWGDLFTARQKLALATFCRLAAASPSRAVGETLALVLSGVYDRNVALATWRPQADQEKVEHLFARQTLSMAWDFGEAAPLSQSTGSFDDRVETVAGAVEALGRLLVTLGQAQQGNASHSPLASEAASVWFTDPPYYDAIPYSDLSDFFFVWLKRALPGHPLLRDPEDAANPLTPKGSETVQDETKQFEGRPKDRIFFERQMAKAFADGRRVLREDGVGCVVFAHKTTEGWEALLSGMIQGGWVITGSWPIATEMATRLRARESAALATSVHLICRPRMSDETGDWSAIARELPKRVQAWMERLQAEGIRGADLVFACIGPALELYSRYPKVVDAEDREIPLGGDPEAREPHKRGYLAYVWEVVGRAALEQVLGTGEGDSGAGAVEEDARLTALFLWTLQATTGDEPSAENGDAGEPEDEPEEDDEERPKKKAKGFVLVFDVVRRFAQPLGIHLDAWEGRIIETDKGVVRLLAVTDRARQLFGEEGADTVAAELEERPKGGVQLKLFVEEDAPRVLGRGRRAAIDVGDAALQTRREATTLDRIHAAMLLQRGGRSNALRALLAAEADRGPEFLRLANALSALYPGGSEEKRLLDGMLLAMPGR